MNRLSPTNQLVITFVLLLCLTLSHQVASGEAHGSDRSQSSFAIAKVELGMNFDSVFKVHPTGSVQREVANCYSFGRAIILPSRTRQTVRVQENYSVLTLDFEPSGKGGRLHRIHYDRIIEPATVDVRRLLDDLATRYGPHSRILYKRKMEPAGRIIGFEWQQHDGATLRVELRREYSNGGEDIRLSLLARLPVSGPNGALHTQPPKCGKR